MAPPGPSVAQRSVLTMRLEENHKMARRLPWALCAVMLVSAWSAAPASAVEYTFVCISANNSGICDSIGGQFVVDVTATGNPNQALFTFTNNGPVASSITDVYFDDGTLLGIASVTDGAGTDFEQGANPPDLPSGNSVNPDFETTAGFSADSESPAPANGANPGESFSILFNLINGKTFADTIAAINEGIACTAIDPAAGGNCDGTLRIGIHVQAIGGGNSDAFILTGEPDIPDTEAPEPASLMLLGTGLGVVGAKLRNRNKKQQTASIQ